MNDDIYFISDHRITDSVPEESNKILTSNIEEAHKETCNLISRKLQNLLNDLNMIYIEIGYSHTEITAKENVVFSSLSDSISLFFHQASTEKDLLSKENEACKKILKRLLEVINDSKGTKSIPDPYVRNFLLSPSSMSNELTIPSLLQRKNILNTARVFVMKSYISKFLNFLDSCIKLKRMVASLPEHYGKTESQLINMIPSMDTCKFYKQYISTHMDDIDAVYKFIKENQENLLQSTAFNDITDSMLNHITDITSLYETEYKNRVACMVKITNNLIILLKELEVDVAEVDPKVKVLLMTYSQNNLKDIIISNSDFKVLENVCQDYMLIKQNRKSEKSHLMSKCYYLWEKLKVSDSYVNEFIEKNNSLSLGCIKNFNDELERLETMKKKLIKTLIEDSWNKITELWGILHYSEDETQKFRSTYETISQKPSSIDDNEKLLEICEAEINDLNRKYMIYKPVLELIEEFKSLQESKLQLEKSSKDSSRLLSRNSHRILLQEEKTRKRVTRYFPKVIDELKHKLNDFAREFNKDLYIDGKKFLDIVIEQERELISKYPRSRINSNNNNIRLKVKSKTSTIREDQNQKLPRKCSIAKKGSSYIKQFNMNKTPSRLDDCMNTIFSNTSLYISNVKPSVHYKVPHNRHLQDTVLTSTPMLLKKPASPRRIIGNESCKILERGKSSPLTLPSGKLCMTENRPFAYRQLSLISPNKLNTRSLIPRFNIEKSSTHFLKMDPLRKKETNELGLRQNLSESYLPTHNLSSGIKESTGSTYELILPEDNRCALNMDETRLSEIEEESSMMDDNNFINWKKEQLAKMSNKHETSVLSSTIKWETDVF